MTDTPESTTKIIRVSLREVKEWALENSVTFRHEGDIGKVNRRRIDAKLPQFVLAGNFADEPLTITSKQIQDRTKPLVESPPKSVITPPPPPKPKPISIPVQPSIPVKKTVVVQRDPLIPPPTFALPIVEAKPESKVIEMPKETIKEPENTTAHEGEIMLPKDTNKEPKKKVQRNLRGLTEALFDELDDFRAGTGSSERLRAVCDMTGRISTLIHAEIKVHQMIAKAEGAESKKRLLELAGGKDDNS